MPKRNPVVRIDDEADAEPAPPRAKAGVKRRRADDAAAVGTAPGSGPSEAADTDADAPSTAVTTDEARKRPRAASGDVPSVSRYIRAQLASQAACAARSAATVERAEREAARQAARAVRVKSHAAHVARTSRGQPVMKGRMKQLLSRIERGVK